LIAALKIQLLACHRMHFICYGMTCERRGRYFV